MRNQISKFWRSKTIKLALIKAFGGIAIAVFTELDLVGYVAITKSIMDIALRTITTIPLSEK